MILHITVIIVINHNKDVTVITDLVTHVTVTATISHDIKKNIKGSKRTIS